MLLLFLLPVVVGGIFNENRLRIPENAPFPSRFRIPERRATWSFTKPITTMLCHLSIMLQNPNQLQPWFGFPARSGLHLPPGLLLWLTFFYYSLELWVWFFPSTTIGHLENLFKLITKCCCFLHSVTYFQAWGVCPECNKISLSRIYIENVPGFSFWRSTRNGQSSRMYPELIILSTSYVEYFSKPEFVV